MQFIASNYSNTSVPKHYTKMISHLIWSTAALFFTASAYANHAEFVPNSYIMEVGRECGSSCRNTIALSSGEDCIVKPVGDSGDGTATWLEVQCASSAPQLTAESLVESASMSGVPVRTVEKNQVFTIQDLWGADEVDGSPMDGERCPESQLGKDVIISVHDTGCTPKGTGFDQIKCRNYVGDSEGENYCGDGHGHGTHVAGTAASGFYGVAPLASVSCMRVLGADGSGSTTGIVSAISDTAKWSRANPSKKVVVNMSLGGGRSFILNNAVKSAVKGSNVIFALAAGNSNKDVKDFSPASAADGARIFAVGAHDSNSRKASFSNYGELVNLSAPGVQIMSTVPGGFKKYSGTSMACPHVAGAIAAVWSTGIEPTLENLTQGGSVTYRSKTKPKLNYMCQRTAKTAFNYSNRKYTESCNF